MGVTKLVSTNTQRSYTISQYAYLVFVYFNGKKPHLQFKFSEIISLVDLKSKLKNMYPDNRRVVKLYYRSLSNNDEKMQFNEFELKTDEYLSVI